MAIRLSHRDPLTPLYRGALGAIQFADGDYDGALALLPRPSVGGQKYLGVGTKIFMNSL